MLKNRSSINRISNIWAPTSLQRKQKETPNNNKELKIKIKVF